MRDGSKRLYVVVCAGLLVWYAGAAKADVDGTAPVVAPEPESSGGEELTDVTLIFLGGAAGETPSPTLDRLRQRLVSVDPGSTIVVFTGNYSSSGPIPAESDLKRGEVEADVRAHVDAVREFVRRGGRVFFLSGNQDYTGREGVRRLRRFINRELNVSFPDDDHHVDVMPHPDCGEPTIVELGDFGVLALINSQWWIQGWDAQAQFNEGCSFHSRSQLSGAVELLTRINQSKRTIFAMHHPIKSLGEHGGHFKAVEHFKPPIAGSFVVWAKQGGLVPQYRNHVRYDSMASSFLRSAEEIGSFVFVSGHDRSLQYLPVGEQQVQIVSGFSGNAPAPVAGVRDDEFARQASGWAELRLTPSHEDRVTLVDGVTGENLFTAELPEIRPMVEPIEAEALPLEGKTAQSTYAKRVPRKSRAPKRVFLGRHYRDAHRLELDFPVLDLSTAEGGLIPISMGGGSQTNSLRLEDPKGTQWVLRSTTKDSHRFLPYPLNETFFITLLVEDTYTATHPAAAIAIPDMAEAVGVFHSKPRLVYLPDQEGLGNMRGFISDEVVLMERRTKPPDEGNLPAHLGGELESTRPLKYVRTPDMLREIEDEPWKHKVDQEMMLRARLFDLFLGDWDRHEDQWRFVRTTDEDGVNHYYPIPQDRDQALSHYDGALFFFARRTMPSVRVLRPLRDDIERMNWLIHNARFIDPVLLNQVPRERWMEIAEEVQAALTDEVIAEGMTKWPKEAYELDGKEIEKKLRGRRDDIVEAAAVFFEKVNEKVEITGSEHPDLLDITYDDDGSVNVAIRRLQEGTEGEPFLDRTFDPRYTAEIRIYALAGHDRIVVHGEPHKKITVRVVSGAGDDVVNAAATATDAPTEKVELARGLKVYDRKKGVEIDPGINVDEKLSKSTYRNHYQRRDVHHEPSTIAGSPGFSINPDDGLYLGGTLTIKRIKFKRRPFASSHSLRAFFATTTLGVDVGYEGVFPETAGPLDQEIELTARTPNSTRNFFGFTDLYTGTGDTGRDFYRVRQTGGEVSYGFVRRLVDNTVRIGIKGAAQLIDTQDTGGRFITISPDVNPTSLGLKLYAGGIAFAGINTFDSAGYPKRGIAAGVSARLRSDVTPNDDGRIGSSGSFAAAVATHVPLDRRDRFTLSSRARVEGIVGDYPFYFAPTVGAGEIRAYNQEQLAGDGIFAQTTNLRAEIVRIKKGLPGAIGIAGAIDHGLAFGPEIEGRSTYHLSVGGLLFWNIIDQVGLTAGYHYGFRGGQRLVITFGALFGSTGHNE